jgi:hypothetical protein
MEFKKIAGFGDSWVFGDELLDPFYAKTNNLAHAGDRQNKPYRDQHCYLGLLGQHYGVPVENYGIPGGSLDSTVWTFLKWLNQTPDPEKLQRTLFLDYKIEVPIMRQGNDVYLRYSINAFNTVDNLDALYNAIVEIQKQGILLK